jgi:hypothetical protein
VVDVEHDALAKGRHVEFVHLLLAHLQIVRLKKVNPSQLLSLRSH